MTPDTLLPLDFPPLVALATEAAQDHTMTFALSCKSDAALWRNIGEESRRARIGAFVRLLSDLTRRESQAVWLGWLAREVGMELPPVGCPGWTYYGASLYLLGKDSPPKDRKGHVFDFGGEFPEFTKCPRLLDPKANPIRALVLAVLTVGSRGGA